MRSMITLVDDGDSYSYFFIIYSTNAFWIKETKYRTLQKLKYLKDMGDEAASPPFDVLESFLQHDTSQRTALSDKDEQTLTSVYGGKHCS